MLHNVLDLSFLKKLKYIQIVNLVSSASTVPAGTTPATWGSVTLKHGNTGENQHLFDVDVMEASRLIYGLLNGHIC